jgi:hypothetical protein
MGRGGPAFRAGVLALAGLCALSPPALAKVTDAQVLQAINRGKEWLISQQKANGSFGGGHGQGESCLAFMTLAYMGMHPNREVMAKALTFHMNLNPDADMGGRQGYALPIRVMGLSYVHDELLGEKRAAVRRRMLEDVLRFKIGQTPDGGWRYPLQPNSGWDFSVTQWPILAMWEASLVGIEVPAEPLHKARELYYAKQNRDGGYAYQSGGSVGSMTAAGLASLYIIGDVLEPGSGCPCMGGRSRRTVSETDRRVDLALDWLSKEFLPDRSPRGGHSDDLYWLYCVERVGIAAGYKRFGTHNWYEEGAAYLVKKQNANGSWKGRWGEVSGTCFALLFLFKGRAPVLFNKLKFDGAWNVHRRDLANLTHYFSRAAREQVYHWQIVDLQAPLDELHDAPILYISAESVPKWTDPEKQKLRQFTDTGGTILFEASCGNTAVRSWFTGFAQEVWPEWPLKKIAQDDPLWGGTPGTPPMHPIKTQPDWFSVHDGIRPVVFFSADDISCAWQMRAHAAKEYLFKLGINLYAYATDGAPKRFKLTERGVPRAADKYAGPLKAGGRTTLRIARVRHAGNWEVGANYGGLEQAAAGLKAAGVTADVTGPKAVPFNEGGVPATGLAGYHAAYLAGSGPFTLTQAEREGLKAFIAGGGLLWFEAAMGAPEFDQALQKLVGQMGWKLEVLPLTHALLTGRMGAALGHNLVARVEFRKSIRIGRLPRAELIGVYADGRLIGVYSPLDVMFAIKPYEAYKCRGYLPQDAEAVAANILLYLTTVGEASAGPA